jgi:hypothetical protein
LPSTLVYLYTAFNSLTTIPTIPDSLTTLHCYSNNLTTLPAISSPALLTLKCFDNPGLTSSEIDDMLADAYTYPTYDLGIIQCMNTAVPTAAGHASIVSLTNGSPKNWTVYYDLVLYNGGSITPNLGNWSGTWFSVTDYSPTLHVSGNDVITDTTIYALTVNETLDGTFDFTYTQIDTLEIHAGLSQAAVDAILYHYDNTYAFVSGWSINLTGNTAPSGAGLANKTSLEGKGATVLVDS